MSLNVARLSVARVAAATLLVGLILAATPALAQEPGDDVSTPPPLDSQKPLAQEAHRHVVWFGGTVWGKVLIVLTGGLFALRGHHYFREKVKRDGLAGRGGRLARRYAEEHLRTLLAHRQFEEAADFVLVLGAANEGPATDRARELEAAELYLKAGRNQKAADLLIKKGRFLRAGEAYEKGGKHELAAEYFIRAGELLRAEKNFLALNDKVACARMWAKAGDSSRAAAYFTETSAPREAGEELEKLGLVTEAVAHYAEAFSQLAANPALASNVGQDPEAQDLFTRVCRLYPKLAPQDRDRFAPLLLKHGIPTAIAHVFKKAGDSDRVAQVEATIAARNDDAARAAG
jgi:tetratricopeptide (TPR) repeat protein